jgi:hypothetical protein
MMLWHLPRTRTINSSCAAADDAHNSHPSLQGLFGLFLQQSLEKMHIPSFCLICDPSFAVYADCRTLALIKPDAVKHMGKIINAITTSGFSIT